MPFPKDQLSGNAYKTFEKITNFVGVPWDEEGRPPENIVIINNSIN